MTGRSYDCPFFSLRSADLPLTSRLVAVRTQSESTSPATCTPNLSRASAPSPSLRSTSCFCASVSTDDHAERSLVAILYLKT